VLESWIAQLRKGLVELCILGALREKEAYGYQILQRLRQAEGVAITDSSVYPILARLAKEDLIAVRLGKSPDGPPRRYFHLTALGRKRFDEMIESWRSIGREVEQFIG
jgi:PadR family transcriptional regulator, regulatory protein PadR